MNNNMIESYQFADGSTLRTYADSDVIESPREWDNLGSFYTDESRCVSPDEKQSNYMDAIEAIAYDLDVEVPYKDSPEDEYNADMRTFHARLVKTGIVLPVYKYEHGASIYSTSPFSCKWDSGQVGYIACTFETIKKEFGDVNKETIAIAKANLQNEVATYTQWVNGEVFGYQIEDAQGDIVDSCWGYYDHDVMMHEAIENNK